MRHDTTRNAVFVERDLRHDVDVEGCPPMPLVPLGPPNEVDYARGRLREYIYVSKTFTLTFPVQSPDYGQPARYICKVFDEPDEDENLDHLPDIQRTEHVVDETPGGRKQVKIQVTRQAGNIRQIEIQRVPTTPGATEMQQVLKLGREASAQLILLARSLDNIPVEGGEGKIRVEDQLLHDIFSNPDAIARIYNNEPDRFRELVEADPEADDVIALAHRKEIVEHFRRLLSDPDFFETERRQTPGGGREAVWQRLLEDNPWILGIGLGGQLFTAWNKNKLEQSVAGQFVGDHGKRTDALLQTSGSIRALVFAEIKHHETELVMNDVYRSGCWAPSKELTSGVVQVQQTMLLAGKQIRELLREKDTDGAFTGEEAYLIRPRSYLILGHLDQLRGAAGGVNPDKFSSFELYRRNLYEPEILTFDELLARAEWHVASAETQQAEQ
jgi:hypothetical protein